MQRRTINILAAFMVISLLGILGLQAYWLKQTIDRSRAEFDQRANRALRASALELSQLDIEMQLKDEIGGMVDEFTWISQGQMDSVIFKLKQEERSLLLKTESLHHKANQLMAIDPVPAPPEPAPKDYIIIESISDKNGNQEIEIIRKQSLEVVERAMQSVIIHNLNTEVSLEELLSNRDLKTIIQKKLSQEGIDINFDYAVFEDSVITEYSSTTDLEVTPYKASLFPDDNLKAFLYLGFSSQGAFVLKNTAEVLILVTLFSLLMIGTTVYAIRFMLQQKRLADMKTDFINNMTHEFKTPLATIGLAADSLRHPKMSGSKAEIDRYSHVISKESQRLNSHIESLLQLAKMERGELYLKKEKLDLIELVKAGIEDNRLLLERSGAKVETRFPETDCQIMVDAYHMRNAISNLIDNAVKYAIDAPEIFIEVKRQEAMAEIVIRDNGRGMSEETKRRAFESFYREQTGNLHEVKGFGVGLSYVKKITEGHEGSIELRSKLGKGTTVILKIPCV